MTVSGRVIARVFSAAVIVLAGCSFNWDALDPAVGPDSGGCPTGRADCDGNPANGCEVDIGSAAEHCGACNRVCLPSVPNGLGACTAGVCGLVCTVGFSNCDGDMSNGCEQPTDADIAHCGSCTRVCASTNATPMCVSSHCAPQCSTGFADCDSNPDNGCESATATDVRNCGSCGHRCTGMAHNCAAGACVN